jgi:beta-phosphoglucomutase-like phosphatase (HAD superfamily)
VLGLPDDVKAVLFDLDGVLTDTASAHKAPDTFLRAADLLGVRPDQAAVFEDALAGVEAGRAGKFRRVIGVNRGHHREALRGHGADIVVDDLGQLLEGDE